MTFPGGISLAQEPQNPITARQSSREIAIRYHRFSGEESLGIGINCEYARVVALALQDNAIDPATVTIEAAYPDVIDEMRKKNLNENLALLSLVAQYRTSSG